MRWLWAVAFTALVLGGTGRGAFAADNIAGRLLVAQPSLIDPNFSKTVILIIRHDGDGAFGLVINRFAEQRSVTDVLSLFNEDIEAPDAQVAVHLGGPVQTASTLALHSMDFATDRTEVVDGKFAVSPTVDALKARAAGHGPAEMRIFFGYAGWAAGQLENEIAVNAWTHVAADADLVFAPDPSQVWALARMRIQIDL
ncbi:MAG: YqgE/AlgH family protein [Proteobacteria bacterium]|nr:YqgE/AlgH family protein [Pseudomonadota bacterium]MDA1057114.1 YqgE/AlgH family protein [Pseudomonadota bacterium]